MSGPTGAARRCPACFVAVDDDALFCDACGARLDTGAPAIASPRAPLPPDVGAATREQYAGFWTRFAAYLVDWIMLDFAALIFVGALVSPSFGFMLVVAPVLYFWIGNSLGGTFAKRMMGLLVVGADGRPPGLGRGLLRYVVSLISTFFVFAGYFWMIGDARRQTWHDKAAGTFVVHRRRVPTGEPPARWAL